MIRGLIYKINSFDAITKEPLSYTGQCIFFLPHMNVAFINTTMGAKMVGLEELTFKLYFPEQTEPGYI